MKRTRWPTETKASSAQNQSCEFEPHDHEVARPGPSTTNGSNCWKGRMTSSGGLEDFQTGLGSRDAASGRNV